MEAHKKILLFFLILFYFIGAVFATTVTLKPSTATHKAYYRTLSNQSGSAPSNPSWAETTRTEFSTADYTAVQTDDASRTSRSVTATTNGRWCAAEEIFEFNLTAYSSITNVHIAWNGYGLHDANYILHQVYVKTASSTWSNIAAMPTSDSDVSYDDTTVYTASGIYKLALFGTSVKIVGAASAAISIYSDSLNITLTYTVAGQNYVQTITETMKFTDSTDKFAGYTRTQTETLRIIDQTFKFRSFVRIQTEALNLKDSFFKYVSFQRVHIEVITFLDSIASALAYGYVFITTERLSLFDTLAKEITVTTTEAIRFTDALFYAANFTSVFTDALTMSDAIATAFGTCYVQVINEVLTFTDVFSFETSAVTEVVALWIIPIIIICVITALVMKRRKKPSD